MMAEKLTKRVSKSNNENNGDIILDTMEKACTDEDIENVLNNMDIDNLYSNADKDKENTENADSDKEESLTTDEDENKDNPDDTHLPADFIEEYTHIVNDYKRIKNNLEYRYEDEIRLKRKLINDIRVQIDNVMKGFEETFRERCRQIQDTKRQATLSTFTKQIEELEIKLKELEQERDKLLSEVNKDLIREELINQNTIMRNFLMDMESAKSKYNSYVPALVKKRVEYDFDLSEGYITEFDIEGATEILDRIADTLDDCAMRLNGDKLHKIIDSLFIFKVETIKGFPMYLASLWHIFIFLAFIVLSIFTIPLYLFFNCLIGIIAYKYQKDLIEAYTALLTLSKVANKYNEDLDGQVNAIYEEKTKAIVDKYLSQSDILKSQLTKLKQNKNKANLEKININESDVRNTLTEELEKTRNTLEERLKGHEKELEEILKNQQQDKITIEEKLKLVYEYKEKLDVFFNPVAENRLNRMIYMNGLFMGYEDDDITPVYLKHNKRAVLLFYDKETCSEQVRRFVYGLYINSTVYMKDGHCKIDLVDVIGKGTDFPDILPTRAVFDNDPEKMDKYLISLKTDMNNLYAELNKDIAVRSELMPRSGYKNIDLFNEERMKTGSQPLAYRVVLFYSLHEGDLNDDNLRFLIKTTGQNSISDKEVNLGVIPIICIPYQYFYKESPEIVLSYVDMVGSDNILSLKDQLVKLTDRELAKEINYYKTQHENYKKSIKLT